MIVKHGNLKTMTTILIYILKWALGLAMLYIPFALLLRRETFATFNRWLLMGIITASAILPAIAITYPVEVEIVKFIGNTGNNVVNVEAATDIVQHVAAPADEGFNWKALFALDTLTIVYFIGVAITFGLRIIEITRIVTGIRRNTTLLGRHNGMKIHCHAGDTVPFSWFGHVVMSQSDYEECGTEILLHEEGHCRNGHSWDMLLLGIVKSLQWFNPFAYMLANDMKEIHEYEADRHVLKHHGNTSSYQLLLLKKAVGETAFNLANNFNQSSVRKRIMMMARKPSGWQRKIKVLSMAPMALLFLFIFARPEYVYSIIEKQATAVIGKEFAQEASSTAQPLIDSTPLPLHAAPAKRVVAPKSIEPIEAASMNAKGIRLAERFEEHATETCDEHIAIKDSNCGAMLCSRNVRRCDVKVQFVADKNGNAHSLTIKSCNLSIAGNAGDVVEECKKAAIEAATGYILAKRWNTAIKSGNDVCTIYDAHIIID